MYRVNGIFLTAEYKTVSLSTQVPSYHKFKGLTSKGVNLLRSA